MKRRIALLVAFALAISIGTSCSSSDKYAGYVRVAIGSQFSTLDPGYNTEVVNNYVITHISAGMFSKNERGEVENELCESYTTSPDGLVWTFKIRDDAKWSDGVAIKANDFVYGLLRALSYGKENAWATSDPIAFIAGAKEYQAAALEVGNSFDCTKEDASSVGIRAIDEKTFELTLIRPCPYLTGLMSGGVWLPLRSDFALQHDSKWAEKIGNPVSGEYTLVEFAMNEKAVLKKNPGFVKEAEVLMPGIIFQVMSDPNAQQMAFEAKEIDIALTVSAESVGAAPPENVWIVPQVSNYFLTINSGNLGPDWAHKVNVRRALALAINKSDVVKVLGGESFYRILNGYVPNGISGISGDFRTEGDNDGYTIAYNPEEAKRLLEEAGYNEANPLKITYKYSNSGIHQDVATILQNQWKAVGIDCTFAAVESGVFYEQIDNGDFEICRYGYVASDDAIQYLQLWTTDIQIKGRAAVDDQLYDSMIDAAMSIVDPAQYYQALHDAEDYLVEDNVYVIPMFNYATPTLVNAKLSGYRSLGGTVNLNRCVFEQ